MNHDDHNDGKNGLLRKIQTGSCETPGTDNGPPGEGVDPPTDRRQREDHDSARESDTSGGRESGEERAEGIIPQQFTGNDARIHTAGVVASREEIEAYARRLVACWNACDKIETKNLENGSRVVQEFDYMRVVVERDEALEALRFVLKDADEQFGQLDSDTVSVVREVLAKHQKVTG